MWFVFVRISDDATKCDIVTTETVEHLINEIGKIKTQMNNTELQLYEANEKIAELIENVSTSQFQWNTLCVDVHCVNYYYIFTKFLRIFTF